ncbi:MAG: radical SAM protein [Tannerellaceae bacterium]|jgi:uncharacterized protein|nr:radical SAM protein [Tannerellaceae bacterium]
MKPNANKCKQPPVNSNLFVVERDGADTYFLYSPLNRKLGLINAAGVDTLNKFFGQQALSEKENNYISELYQNKFLNDEELTPPVFPKNYGFFPHEVTLFITSRCNLRCRYCYAEAGKKSVDMDFRMAQAAVDLVAHNAGYAGLPKFAVGFHGGGEPTTAWPLLTDIVEYAKKTAEKKGLDVELFAATNGMLNKVQREYILRNFTGLNISFDGPADIQDFYRPTVGGAGSFATVRDNLKFFSEAGFPYGIRATVTDQSVCRLVEMVEWMKQEFNPDFLHVEPVWQCGRCLTTGEHSPSDNDFIRYFTLARQRAEEMGLQLVYSGLRIDSLLSKFCAAPGDGFNVLPEGIVTSCYEITEGSDPKAELFHYGYYSPETQSFVFDKEKIERLKHYSVEYLDFCRNCFCKWHCAGDCISKVFGADSTFAHKGSSRCRLNRNLTRIQLEKMINYKP